MINYFTKKFKLLFSAPVAVLFLSVAFTASAQTVTVKGKVSSTVEPLENATVVVDSKGIVTDAEGNYTLQAPAGRHTITVSYVGYKLQTQSIILKAGKTEIFNFVLQQASQLDEVEVIGSRNAKRATAESPVPIDIVPLKQIANLSGQLDVAQLLTVLAPSFYSVRQT
ncbi:MAG: carboxypeptidase-like regulatory domain-containing protein, partial [Chitinophagaceae bacterium]|nr:carboxypeptidase-like regulatory domain-containing protein [Chitinophagaceae bacterium]